MAGGTESAGAAGKHQKPLLATVRTANPGKPAAGIEAFGWPEMFIRITLFSKDGSNKSEYLLREDNNGNIALVEDDSVFVSIDENFQVLRMFKNNHPGFKIEADLALKIKDGGYKIHSYESIRIQAGYEEDRFYKNK